jgi:hypothetical protein
MAWALVQSASGSTASGTSVAATYGSNVTAGNKLIAAVSVKGSIGEDASTPPAATKTVTSATMAVTTASFSPPAGTLLVATLDITHASGTPSVTMSSTIAGNPAWTTGPALNAGTNYAAVFYLYLASAPGAITVTATNSTSQSQNGQLSVRVVTGAASAQGGAGSNTASGTSTSFTGSVTTTETGSRVYLAVAANAAESSITPNGATTTIANYQPSGGETLLSGRSSAGTGTPGSTAFGWTAGSSTTFTWAGLEILPSVTCTQVQDGSANSWVQLGAAANANQQTSLWALDTPAADAGTAPALTATFSVSAAGSIVIEEVSGLQAGATAAAMLDGTAATLTGATQNPGSPTYTSTAASEYLICVYGDAGTSVTATQHAGWTIDANSVNTSANAGCCVEYKNSTSGSETDGWTTSAASQWTLVEAAFLLASATAVYTIPYAPGPGLFTSPDPSFLGVLPWAGDPSLANFNPLAPGYISGTGIFAGQKTALGAAKGYESGTAKAAAPVIPQVVNQWAGSYGQGTTFTSISSAFQSCVIQLNAASSVGGGTGTPTAGNWLFTIASWTQDPSITTVHIGTYDDIHSWWRQFPASSSSGNTRTGISYTANLARVPGYVYVAPDASVAAVTVLVVEVSGLGPWDTVAGTGNGYAGAATSVSLSLSAPGAASFIIGAAGGDSTAAGQAFAPSGWTTLRTVSQSNGTNQLASSYLTPAYLASSSSSQSVSGTASTDTDLSGFLLAVYTEGLDPVPAAQNPAWPWMIFEAGFGSGFNTPDSEITWTDITSRLWDWDETTGVQFQLGQLQATNLTMEMDNNDGYLSPENSSSPFFPNLLPGTPLRLRAALGTIGGATVNRWYILQRNAGAWDEQITGVYRRYVPVAGTDLWASLTSTPPTFYRSEVYEDNPYAWWPADDQPGNAGVLPAWLLNAAIGNTNVLNIAVSPSKGTVQPYYTTGGASTITGTNTSASTIPEFDSATGFPPGLAVYQVGANGGWMFGDPQSQAPSLATGNSVSATPGSASWQVTGLAGNSGSNGWFLYCNDSNFPALAAGVTVEIWFKVSYYAGSTAWNVATVDGNLTTQSLTPITQQPYNQPVTIWEMATGSNPVCILQLSSGLPGSGGALNLITYNGSAATSHPVYSTSDLRDNSWHMAAVTLTTTTWQVYLDGGANATVSGTAAGMTSAWTWLIANGDLGSAGGSAAGTGLVHGANMALSHIAVYPYQLPYYRILDHYWAAISAFGQLPAPQAVQVSMSAQQFEGYLPIGGPQFIAIPQQNALTADGSSNPQHGGYHASKGTGMAAVVTAIAPGGITSGPSAWTAGSASYAVNEVQAGIVLAVVDYVDPFITWTGVAPQFAVYTGSSTAGETQSAVTAGDSEAFTGGFGGSASGGGVSHVSGGNGSVPPAAGSPVGDTAGQRIERLMRAGRSTSPKRSIDPSPLLVQAPGSNAGGQQTGAAIQSIQQSDSGLLFIDNCGNLVYWMRSHLASQYNTPVWQIGPTTAAGRIPYWRQARWVTDPQRVYNVVQVVPFSPSGAVLPLITPASASAAQASQTQYGAQPLQVQSWLQSPAEMQSQANWLLSTWGTARRRVEQVRIDAASHPQAWELAMGINIGDVVQVEDWQVGGGGTVYTFRVSGIRRHFVFGSTADAETQPEATVELQCDYEPTSYWT